VCVTVSVAVSLSSCNSLIVAKVITYLLLKLYLLLELVLLIVSEDNNYK